ncbi:EpsG family protein [Plesiomonas shigelloides]|uniref:EpsG family protein n=1 Tax=Plesiomonas shigelloides TaxID=703 RepID=UPI00387F28C9
MLIIIFTIIAGLRVGVKPDWYNYAWVFENFQVERMFDYSAYSKEPGYMVLNYIVREVYDSKYLLFSVIAFMSIGLTFYSYFKFSSNPFLCVLIYCSFFFINRDMGAIRAGIAYSIFLFGLIYINNIYKYLSIVLIASTFHITSLLAICIPILKNRFCTPKMLALMIITSCIFGLTGLATEIIRVLSNIDISLVARKSSAYLSSEDLVYEIDFLDLTNIKSLLFSFFSIYNYDKFKIKNSHFSVIIFVYVIGTCFRLAFSDLGVIAGRGYTIFNTVEPILISYFYGLYTSVHWRIIYYVGIIIYGITFMYLSINKYQTLPYDSLIF